MIHDCEKTIEIKNKGIKHGYIVKCEYCLEIKRKFMLALKWRGNIFGFNIRVIKDLTRVEYAVNNILGMCYEF